MFDSSRSHGLQNARLVYPPLSPGVCSDSCLLSWWCHPAVWSFVTSFFSCPQSFPASGSFPVSQLFISDGQSIEVSALASILPMNIQGCFLYGWLVWSPWCLRYCKSLLQHHTMKTSVLPQSAFSMVQFSHLDMTTGKTVALTV